MIRTNKRRGVKPDDTPQHSLLTITPQLTAAWLNSDKISGSRRY